MKNIFSLTGLIAAILLCFSVQAQLINKAEYFFDSDPGLGNGTAITISSPADSVDITGSINTTGLPAGFHSLFIRTRNVNGVWSLYEGRRFYVNPVSVTSQVQITNAEYFFDNDPGLGNGTAIATGSAADSIDITSSVSTSGLQAGFHSLFVRVKNQSGVWSLYEGRRFYVNPTPTSSQLQITNAEYFFDSDPGLGNGTSINTGAAADSIDITSSVSTTGLQAGFHSLFVRVENQSGIWSLYEGRRFYLDVPPVLSGQIQIVKAETFFDNDPGVGNGTAVTPAFAPADSVDLNRSVSATGLSEGEHYLFVRVQNAANQWSMALGDSFNICSYPPIADFTDSISGPTAYFTDSSVNADSYRWNFGDGDTSSSPNPFHNYLALGSYTVTLTITDSCGSNTKTDTVVITNLNGIHQLTGSSGRAIIYPNPNDGNFVLSYSLPSANSELQIMDITGRLFYNKVISGNEGLQQINIPDLSNGIFYWRIVSDNELSTNGKIVIAR